jgi:uncharacterized protein YjbI with pentapeptide repeats
MLVSKSSSPKEIAAKLDVRIKRHQLSTTDMAEFSTHVQKQKAINPNIKVSLIEYVKEKFYSGEDDVVVPGFSGAIIGKTIEYDTKELREAFDVDKSIGMSNSDKENESDFLKNMKVIIDDKRALNLDLSGVDFTGCRLENAKFLSCDLTGVDARDADLNGVELIDCIAANMDLRGASINGLKFSEINLNKLFWQEDINIDTLSTLHLLEYDCNQRYSDIHLSTVESMLHRYAVDNGRLEKDTTEEFKERQAKNLMYKKESIRLAEGKVKDAYANVTYIALIFGGESLDIYVDIRGAEALNIAKLKKEIDEINQQEFDQTEENKIKYVVHPSVISNLLIVNESVQNKYDPSYKRGRSQSRAQDKIQYIRLARIDAERYLEECKKNPKLSINKFAKSLMDSKGIKAVSNARVVADFSVYIDKKDKNAEYSGITTDLSKLDFSSRDLSGACFVGSNVQDCKFVNAKLDNATFEGVDASRANFTEVSARDSNFKAAKIQSAVIKDADFTRAYMPHARVYDLKRDENINEKVSQDKLNIENSNFNLSDMSNTKLDGVVITGSRFDYTDLSGASLANADIQKCRMVHANLENAILSNCKIIESKLTNSILRGVEARKSTFRKIVLKDVDARKMDFTESEIDEFCIFENTQLVQAIMRKVKADKVKFIGANMQAVNLQQASLKSAIIERVNLKLSNLEGAIADGIKAAKVDIRGADLTDILARGADFKAALFEGVKGYGTDFSGSVMEAVNLRRVKMHDSILELVNFKKVDLRDAKLERVNLNNANVNQAKVNDKTDLHNAKAKDVQGDFEYEASDGAKIKLTPEKKIERDNQVYAAKNRGFVGKLYNSLSAIGSIFQKIGKKFQRIVNPIIGVGRAFQKIIYVVRIIGFVLKKIGQFMESPFNTKVGKILGAVIGIIAVGAIVASAVGTVGSSLPAIATVAALTIIVGGGVGAAVGIAVSRGGVASTIIGAWLGGLIGGPIGSTIGTVIGALFVYIIKEVTGKTLDERAADWIQKVGDKIESFSDEVIRNEEALVKYRDVVIEITQDVKKENIEKELLNKPRISLEQTKLLSKKIQTYREIVMSDKQQYREREVE